MELFHKFKMFVGNGCLFGWVDFCWADVFFGGNNNADRDISENVPADIRNSTSYLFLFGDCGA